MLICLYLYWILIINLARSGNPTKSASYLLIFYLFSRLRPMFHNTDVIWKNTRVQNAQTQHIAKWVLSDTHRQYWRWTITETMHHAENIQHSVILIQNRNIVEEKWRIVKGIGQLKWTDKKVKRKCTSLNKTTDCFLSRHQMLWQKIRVGGTGRAAWAGLAPTFKFEWILCTAKNN